MSRKVYLLSLLLLLLAACSSQTQPAAPLGDHGVLEQLAEAYRATAQQYPMQPKAMPPEGRREFVERVFKAAGYDYSATLLAMARQGADVTNAEHRDLAELLFLPHAGISNQAMGELYSEQELAAIYAIQADLR
jgi:hypothetical protein